MTIVELSTLLERAQASQNIALVRALALSDPSSGASVLQLPGAIGVYFGEGHPLNQGLALGLGSPLDGTGLEQLEGLLGRGGHPVVVELAPGADAALSKRLSSRGFFIRQFQQVWMRELDASLAPTRSPLVIRPARTGEALLFARLALAGFSEQDELPAEGTPLPWPAIESVGTTAWIAWDGDRPVAGGTLGLAGEVAALSGTSVLPSFRGRGLHRALISARLEAARAAGACLAVSATVPYSVSAMNLVREGFRAAYPKVEMANR